MVVDPDRGEGVVVERRLDTAMGDKNLGDRAFRVLCVVSSADHGLGCDLTNKDIAQRAATVERGARQSLADLVQLGYLRKEPDSDIPSGRRLWVIERDGVAVADPQEPYLTSRADLNKVAGRSVSEIEVSRALEQQRRFVESLDADQLARLKSMLTPECRLIYWKPLIDPSEPSSPFSKRGRKKYDYVKKEKSVFRSMRSRLNLHEFMATGKLIGEWKKFQIFDNVEAMLHATGFSVGRCVRHLQGRFIFESVSDEVGNVIAYEERVEGAEKPASWSTNDMPSPVFKAPEPPKRDWRKAQPSGPGKILIQKWDSGWRRTHLGAWNFKGEPYGNRPGMPKPPDYEPDEEYEEDIPPRNAPPSNPPSSQPQPTKAVSPEPEKPESVNREPAIPKSPGCFLVLSHWAMSLPKTSSPYKQWVQVYKNGPVRRGPMWYTASGEVFWLGSDNPWPPEGEPIEEYEEDIPPYRPPAQRP